MQPADIPLWQQEPQRTPAAAALAAPFKVVDADNHKILLNRPGMVSLVIGTSEDSQDAAREAGKAVYPFQGLPDFQLIVVVDLHDSVASWVPSVVINQMRSSLDKEAIELKPYFVKNGNKNNPRSFSHVVADFTGTTSTQLGWPETADYLHAVLFGPDGHEAKRWNKVESMDDMATAVKAALVAHRTSLSPPAPPAKPVH